MKKLTIRQTLGVFLGSYLVGAIVLTMMVQPRLFCLYLQFVHALVQGSVFCSWLSKEVRQ